jgi:LytS/YehU family sensor histidine kinase
MNPHFLYNALNTLQGLIYTKKVDEAGTFVSMFSDHLRHTLNMSEKQMITLRDEIESLFVYLELEKLRFGDDFHFEIKKESNVSDLVQIPSMIIQPFVENAVKHGLLNKKGRKNVRIHFMLLENQLLQISIVDNGIGREQSNLLNLQRKDKPKSFATKAIENRIDLLNKQSKHQITIRIDDLKDKNLPTGTAVYLVIPLKFD